MGGSTSAGLPVPSVNRMDRSDVVRFSMELSSREKRPPRTDARGMRPASRASRPASTAERMACAIRAGRCARVTAVASSTASQPSSIASAASLAVPIPASRITGTSARSTISSMLCGLRMPSPEPIGEPSGITAAQPACFEPAGQHRIVVGVRQHHEAVGDQLLGRVEQLDRVGQQGALVGDHLELDPVGLQRLAGQLGGQHGLAGGEAAGGVGQHPRCRAGRARRAPSRGRPGRPGASRPWSARCRRRPAPAPAPPGWARRRCP